MPLRPILLNGTTNANSINPSCQRNEFKTPVLTATTTYYVLNDNGSCVSNRILFHYYYSAPAAPVVHDPNFRTCYNEPLALRATGNGFINWYATATGNIVLEHDSVFITGRLTRDTVFYARN